MWKFTRGYTTVTSSTKALEDDAGTYKLGQCEYSPICSGDILVNLDLFMLDSYPGQIRWGRIEMLFFDGGWVSYKHPTSPINPIYFEVTTSWSFVWLGWIHICWASSNWWTDIFHETPTRRCPSRDLPWTVRNPPVNLAVSCYVHQFLVGMEPY